MKLSNSAIVEMRIKDEAHYILSTHATVRKAATVFGVSKSTIHKDMTQKLIKLNPSLSKQVLGVLEYNKSIRHLRGGQATRVKYKGVSKSNLIKNQSKSLSV